MDTVIAPVSVIIQDSISVLPDSCMQAYTLVVPTEPTRNINNPIHAIKIANLIPPQIEPADFYCHMQNYTSANGLTLDLTNCAFTDKRGNLWFGTRGGGVSCYNGKTFTNYTSAQGLAHNFVWSIKEDKKGNIWFGTNGGASCYDGKSFTNFTTKQGLPSNGVLRINEDKMGNLWFGTNGGGVSSYDGRTFTNYTTVDGLISNTVWSITEDKIGNLWFGTGGGGISRYDGNRVVAIERGDDIAMSTQQDIKKVNGKLVKSFTNYTFKEMESIEHDVAFTILEDKIGNLWIGLQYGGAICYDGNRIDAIERGDTIAARAQQGLKKINGKFIKSFTHFTTSQGLANNWVWDIKEDNSGNIWFATNGGGVSCYNGKSFTNYTKKQGLANNFVFGITEDQSGNLWFGNYGGGISRYNGKSFTNYTVEQGLANNVVWSITEDKVGNLWFGTDGDGVSCYDGNRIEDIEGGDTVAAKNLQNLIRVNGQLIKSFTNYARAQGFMEPVGLCTMEDKVGNLWFGSYCGMSRFDGNRVDAIKRGDTIARRNQRDLQKMNGQLVKAFTNYISWDNAPAYNSVLCMKEDQTGNLWLGTKKGVIRYDGNRVDAITNGDPGAISSQRDIKRKNGEFIKSFTNYTVANGLVGSIINCITEDNNGNFWFGTSKGVSFYDGKSFANYTTKQGLGNNNVWCITKDKMGNLWLGTDGGGVSRFDGKTFLNYTTSHGLPDNVVTQVLITKEDNILFGTNSGLAMLTSFSYQNLPQASHQDRNNKTSNMPAQNSLSNSELENRVPAFEIYNSATGYPVNGVNTGQNAMFLDSKGIIWIGTASDKTGLVRFDYKALNRNTKPLNVAIQSIKISGENILWNNLISTPERRNTRTDSITTPANITEEVTVLGKRLSEAERDTMRQKFGNIQFDGIAKFYPIPEKLVLPYEHNHITFDFAAVEPARPYLVRYQYMLEGYDKDWSPITDKSEAVFGNMYEGSYTFKLKARSPFGIWSEPIEYKFKVLPPWWRSWRMKTIYGIIFLLMVIGIYFYVMYRIKMIRKREEEKTLLNKKREEEKTRLNKKISEIEMKALRSQMNPHFIFNVMNSVQNYILKEDSQSAYDYLAKFARLMRLVLENSKAENITLKNEIETLRLYVMLEQLRAPGKFTYKVNVEPSISAIDTLIMPMLIQPFIENAIVHGIMPKDGNDGEIILTIKKSNDQLICLIEDNGIGRKSAQKIKPAGSHTHKSLGMNVTEERISILNNLHGKNASVIIEDQTDQSMNASGTKVILTIPFMEQFDTLDYSSY